MSEYTKTKLNLIWRWKKWKKKGRGQNMSEFIKTKLNIIWRWKSGKKGSGQNMLEYTKFVTNASGVIWWPNLELMQKAPSGDQISN